MPRGVPTMVRRISCAMVGKQHGIVPAWLQVAAARHGHGSQLPKRLQRIIDGVLAGQNVSAGCSRSNCNLGSQPRWQFKKNMIQYYES